MCLFDCFLEERAQGCLCCQHPKDTVMEGGREGRLGRPGNPVWDKKQVPAMGAVTNWPKRVTLNLARDSTFIIPSPTPTSMSPHSCLTGCTPPGCSNACAPRTRRTYFCYPYCGAEPSLQVLGLRAVTRKAIYVGVGAKDSSSLRNWEKVPCVSSLEQALYLRWRWANPSYIKKCTKMVFMREKQRPAQLIALNTLLRLRTLDIFCTAHLMDLMAFQGQFCIQNLPYAFRQDTEARRIPIQNTAAYGSAVRVALFPSHRAVCSTDSVWLSVLCLLNNYKKEIWRKAVTWESKC